MRLKIDNYVATYGHGALAELVRQTGISRPSLTKYLSDPDYECMVDFDTVTNVVKKVVLRRENVVYQNEGLA
ncbi:hypothetical protein OAA60_00745 [Porticoccaceae bacterium]|nr:hypothetical protein [Porticoccaceae bacterium]